MDYSSLDAYELLGEAFWDVLSNENEETALTTFFHKFQVDEVRSTDWNNFSVKEIAKTLDKLPQELQDVHKAKFMKQGVDIDKNKHSEFTVEDHKNDRVLSEFDIKMLKTETWYRGTSRQLDDFTVGREGYGVFITNNLSQALTYAGEDGFIAEVELPENFKCLRHSPNYGRLQFSPTTFDDEAKSVSKSNVGVVARDVCDDGPHRELGYGARSINIALNRINDLKLKSVRPAIEFTHKSKLTANAAPAL